MSISLSSRVAAVDESAPSGRPNPATSCAQATVKSTCQCSSNDLDTNVAPVAGKQRSACCQRLARHRGVYDGCSVRGATELEPAWLSPV